jgi:hypothetical protein
MNKKHIIFIFLATLFNFKIYAAQNKNDHNLIIKGLKNLSPEATKQATEFQSFNPILINPDNNNFQELKRFKTRIFRFYSEQNGTTIIETVVRLALLDAQNSTHHAKVFIKNLLTKLENQ